MPIPTRRRPRSPSVTPLGFTCFTCIRIHGGDPDAPTFAMLPNPASRTRMHVLVLAAR